MSVWIYRGFASDGGTRKRSLITLSGVIMKIRGLLQNKLTARQEALLAGLKRFSIEDENDALIRAQDNMKRKRLERRHDNA